MGWMISRLTCYGIVIYEGIIASLPLYPKYLDKYYQSIFTIVQENFTPFDQKKWMHYTWSMSDCEELIRSQGNYKP